MKVDARPIFLWDSKLQILTVYYSQYLMSTMSNVSNLMNLVLLNIDNTNSNLLGSKFLGAFSFVVVFHYWPKFHLVII